MSREKVKEFRKFYSQNIPHINNFCEFLIFLECPYKEADWSNRMIDQLNRFLTLQIRSEFAKKFKYGISDLDAKKNKNGQIHMEELN